MTSPVTSQRPPLLQVLFSRHLGQLKQGLWHAPGQFSWLAAPQELRELLVYSGQHRFSRDFKERCMRLMGRGGTAAADSAAAAATAVGDGEAVLAPATPAVGAGARGTGTGHSNGSRAGKKAMSVS